MTSAFAGRLIMNPAVAVNEYHNRNGDDDDDIEDDDSDHHTRGINPMLDNQLDRLEHLDARTFKYMFLYCVVFDDLNQLRMVGEKPHEAARKIGAALETYGMKTVEILEFGNDETGEKKIKNHVQGIRNFLAQSPSLREFRYASRHKVLPTLYLKALQQNPHFFQKLHLKCAHLPMEALCDFLQQTKSLSYLLLDGNIHVNRPYHIQTPQLKQFCLALAANTSLQEIDLLVLDWNNHRNSTSRRKLYTQRQNTSVRTVRFRNGNADAHSVYNLFHVLGAAKEMEWTYMGRHNNAFLESLNALGARDSLRLDFTSPIDQPPDPTVMKEFIRQQTGLKHLSLNYGTAPSLRTVLTMSNKVLAAHPSLQSLSLGHVGDTGLEYLARVPLVQLDVSLWAMEIATPKLYDVLQQRHCTVQDLTVRMHTMESFGDLCRALRHNQSIKSFTLVASPSRPSHRLISEDGYEVLEQCLPEFTFTKLSVSGAGIQQEFCHRLFQALDRQGNDHLQSLEIEGILNLESMALLCNYLQQETSSLSTLVLKSDKPNIPTDSMDFLLTTLSAAVTSVETLDLCCKVSELRTVSGYIPRISTLKSLTLHVFNDMMEAWTSERLKVNVLIDIEKSTSLQEFHCNLDEESHFFHNRIFWFNQRRKIDELLPKQVPLSLWPLIMERLQKTTHCPSLLYYILNAQANTLFSPAAIPEPWHATAQQPWLGDAELLPKKTRAARQNEDKEDDDDSPVCQAPPETAPPRQPSAEDMAYLGCGCMPFFSWSW